MTNYTFPLRKSSNSRYLEDQNGLPFLIHGDAPWALCTQLTRETVISFLDDRVSRGYNTVLVEIIEIFLVNAPNNVYGDGPFSTVGDFTTPNEAYWLHVDWVINECNKRNLLFLASVCFLGFFLQEGEWSWVAQSNGTAGCGSYGVYLGNRYKNVNNIIWVMGGDCDPAAFGLMDEVNAMANGIKSMDTVRPKLMTAHCRRFYNTITFFDQPWLDINTTYDSTDTTLTASARDYGTYLTRSLPFFMIEGWYENEHSTTIVGIRSQAYWNLLSGSCGQIFGNCPIWTFGSSNVLCGSTDWQGQLNSSGNQSMTHIYNVFKDVAWHTFLPDTNHLVVTSGHTNAAVSQTADRSALLGYFPSSRTVTVDSSKFKGKSLRVSWYNPSNGVESIVGFFKNKNSQQFTPPQSGDWVLVVKSLLPPRGVSSNSSKVKIRGKLRL